MNIETFNEATLLFGIFVVLLIIGQAIFYFLQGFYRGYRMSIDYTEYKKNEIEVTAKGFDDIIEKLNVFRNGKYHFIHGDKITINESKDIDSFTFIIK